MKLPFRRKSSTTDSTPPEITEYYTSEQRDRRGATWLLGAGVFILTVLIVLGLFYGGKAIYQAVTDDNTPTEQADTGDQQPSPLPGDNEQPNTDTPDTSDENEEESETPAEEPTTTPNTGPGESDAIPNTGPSSNL